MPRRRSVTRTVRVTLVDALFLDVDGESTYHKECALTSAEKKNNDQLLKMVQKVCGDDCGRPVRICSKRSVLRSYTMDEARFVALADCQGETDFDPLADTRGRKGDRKQG